MKRVLLSVPHLCGREKTYARLAVASSIQAIDPTKGIFHLKADRQ